MVLLAWNSSAARAATARYSSQASAARASSSSAASSCVAAALGEVVVAAAVMVVVVVVMMVMVMVMVMVVVVVVVTAVDVPQVVAAAQAAAPEAGLGGGEPADEGSVLERIACARLGEEAQHVGVERLCRVALLGHLRGRRRRREFMLVDDGREGESQPQISIGCTRGSPGQRQDSNKSEVWKN
jgi:hypothetical protein